MGKRSDFDRVDKDLYQTHDRGAVTPLLCFIPQNAKYAELCVGHGALVENIHQQRPDIRCVFGSDINPQYAGAFEGDFTEINHQYISDADFIITNPPWSRDKKSNYLLHRMIEHFRKLKPTWLLIDSDWKETGQAAPFMKYCAMVVAIGRVKWIPGTSKKGKDNCAWYLFVNYETTTRFVSLPEKIKKPKTSKGKKDGTAENQNDAVA